jgi:tetratricopeptide (TPR) repeat protein
LSAWALFNQGNLTLAESGFKTARAFSDVKESAYIDATYGLGLIALREKDLTTTRKFANELPETDTRRSDLIARLDLLALPDDLSKVSESDLRDLIEKNQSANAAVTLGWRLFNEKKPEQALALFEQAERFGGGDQARLALATTLLSLNDTARAQAILSRIETPSSESDALRGQLKIVSAWAALNSGNIAQARILANQIGVSSTDGSDVADEIFARADLREAEVAFNGGELNKAITLATKASKHPKVSLDAKRLVAGAQFQLRQFENASNTYLELYAEKPDTELLEPLYNSLINSYGLSEANARVASLGPEAQKALSARRSEISADKSLFFAAYDIAPQRWPDLTGINEPWVQVGARFRATNGDRGFDRFREHSYQAAARLVSGKDRFTLSLDFINVGIGSPTVGEQITPLLTSLGNTSISDLPTAISNGLTELAGGNSNLTLNGLFQSAQSNVRLEDLTNLSGRPATDLNGIAPRISWTREGFWQPFASIGLTPINGEVSAVPVGEIGVTRYLSTGTQITGRLYAQNRTDSLLSLSGNVDPFTGEDFGRAIEIGGEVSALIPISPRWTISTSASAASIVGDDIDTNERYRAQIGISRNINLNNFKYFAVGPSVQFETNSENHDFFTFGNGGYFSPQAFVRTAANLNFQTKERHRFIIRGTASIAFEYIETDDRFILPNSLIDAGNFQGSNSTGIAGNALVEGIYRLSDKWVFGGYLGGAAANDFSEAIGGIYLRYTFGKRDALVSTDIFPPQLGFSQR